MTSHPEAQAIPVSVIGEGSKRPMIYIWLIDKDESLNLHLVKSGAFPADVMLDAVHFSDMSKGSAQQKSIRAGIDAYRRANPTVAPPQKEGTPRRLQPDAAYASFLKQLADADRFARSQHLGVWAAGPTKASSPPPRLTHENENTAGGTKSFNELLDFLEQHGNPVIGRRWRTDKEGLHSYLAKPLDLGLSLP